jgi:hypothetical protein
MSCFITARSVVVWHTLTANPVVACAAIHGRWVVMSYFITTQIAVVILTYTVIQVVAITAFSRWVRIGHYVTLRSISVVVIHANTVFHVVAITALSSRCVHIVLVTLRCRVWAITRSIDIDHEVIDFCGLCSWNGRFEFHLNEYDVCSICVNLVAPVV